MVGLGFGSIFICLAKDLAISIPKFLNTCKIYYLSIPNYIDVGFESMLIIELYLNRFIIYETNYPDIYCLEV